MKIEVVDAYLLGKKNGKALYSMHVYIIDFDIDLRGIQVIHKGVHWFFKIPSAFGYDQETGKKINFPLISFTKKEKHLELVREIRSKGIPFLQEKIKTQTSKSKTLKVKNEQV